MSVVHIRYLRGTDAAERWPHCNLLDESDGQFYEFVRHTVNAWEMHAPEDCDGQPGLRGES